MSDLATILAADPDAETLRLRQGVVTQVSPALLVRVGAADTATPARALGSYAPVVNHVVSILEQGSDRLVLGPSLDGTTLGTVGYAERTTDQMSITALTDLTGLTYTFTAQGGRRYRITGTCEVSSSVAGDFALLNVSDGSGTQIKRAMSSAIPSGRTLTVTVIATHAPAAGSVTYKLRLGRDSGSGSLTMSAQSNNPASILVEDIGPA